MLNIGYVVMLPLEYKIKINIKYNSIQIKLEHPKLTSIDIDKINYFILNNSHIKFKYVHASYQVNIGSELIINSNDFYSNSFELLQNEISIMKKININNLIIHTGKNKNNFLSNKQVLKNMKKMINLILKKFNINIILETSSCQGSETLCNLNDFVNFISKFKNNKNYDKLNICNDTCHIFQAGYDLNNNDIINKVHNIFKPLKNKIKIIHFNDSYYECGMNIDRHEIIGKGKINIHKLKKFVSVYKNIPLICEFKITTQVLNKYLL